MDKDCDNRNRWFELYNQSGQKEIKITGAYPDFGLIKLLNTKSISVEI